MTRKEFIEISETESLNNAIEKLSEEIDDIHDFEILMEMAKSEIDNENIGMALHILQGVYNSAGTQDEWFKYDRTMGKLQEVIAINSIDDIDEFLD